MEATLNLEKALTQVVNKLNGWVIATFKMLPNLVVAIMVIVLFWILARITQRFSERAIRRVSRHTHVARLLATITRLAVIAIGLILALNVMNLDKAVASLLAGVGILGIAFGFASKDIAANFMAGILLHLVHPFRIGDFVRSGDFLGYIESLDLRFTIMRNQQGQRITIPNQEILGKPIVNFTITGIRRVDLNWSLTQVEDLQKAEELALKAVESLELRNPDRPVELFYEKVGDYTIDYQIRFWTEPDQKTWLKARSEAIKAIKLIYEEHGIPMPSPVRVLDFGIVGGTSLRKQLEGLQLPCVPSPARSEEQEQRGKQQSGRGQEKQPESD